MVEIRFITEDEVDDFRHALVLGFGDDLVSEPGDVERFLSINAFEATIAAFDRGRMVATFGSFDLDLTVPGGGSVATAGTTQVTVHPTHRRRGILTEMMTMHLRQAIERDQPMAALWAAEELIYGRFGYGAACFGAELRISNRTIELPPASPDVGLCTLDEDEARTGLPMVYDRALATTPGFFARSAAWWNVRMFHDAEHKSRGASKRRYVLASRDDEAAGYVVYRQRQPEKEGEEGQTEIVELVAVDDEARRALWHFITNVDLFRNVLWWNAPTDEPLLLEADRFRMIQRRENDTMWLRILDVPRVLEARSYERDGMIVLDVADPFLDRGGRFRLEVENGRACCASTSDTADVELALSDLGSLYLGGGTADALARAGRLTGPSAAIRTMTDLFHTIRPPFCIEVF